MTRLFQNNEIFKNLFDILPVGISITDPDGAIIGCNKASETILGLNKGEHLSRKIGSQVWKIIREDGTPMQPSEYTSQKALDQKTTYCDELMGVVVDEEIRWISVSASYLNEPGLGVVITYIDRTETKRAELKIKETEKRWQMAIEGNGDGLWDWDIQSDKVYFSVELKRMLGYSDSEFENNLDAWKNKIHPEDLDSVYRDIQNYFEGKSETYINQHRLLCKDGSYKWILDRGIVIERDSANAPKRMIGIHHDISRQKDLENQLVMEKNFISTIIDNANAIVAVIDPEGTMMKINTYGTSFTGFSEEMIGSQPYFWKRFLPLEVRPKVVNIVKNARKGIINKSFRNHWISKTGEKRFFEWSNTLVKKADGSMDYLATIGIDITEQEKVEMKLKDQKTEFETIFNVSKDGIAILDLESNFIDFNEAYREMTGFSRKELLSKSCIGLSIPEDVPRAVEALQRVMRDGYINNFEKTCIVKNNRHITINMTVALMPDKNRLLITTKNVTAQKQLQNELLHAKEEAEKASFMKSNFLANMSHEIRTPLNGIIGITELLLQTDLSKQQHDYLIKSKQSSKALLGVINDILDYSKIEAGKLVLESIAFDLDHSFSLISDLFSYQAQEKGVQIYFKIDPHIPTYLLGDPLRLTQILTNLVGNAVKFTQQGHINLSVTKIDQSQDEVKLMFSVKDTGIGIQKEHLKRLFKPFEQVDISNTREYGGSGLGLVISQQLIELMGGKIEIQSTYGEGSEVTFVVTFHYDIQHQLIQERKTLLKNKKFLIVDEQKIDRELVNDILRSWETDVTVCTKGATALELIRDNAYDYIILNWKISDIGGIDILQKIQTTDQAIHPTIIMVTANSLILLEKEANEKEVLLQSVLVKPFTPSMLFNAIINATGPSSNETNFENSYVLFENKKILLVEDNEINQMVANDLFQTFGLNVSIATDGQSALALAQKEHFDLIFMDLQMPIMDGFEASRKIRTFDTETPIVALSAAAMLKDKELASEAGMNAHIAKPIDMDELQRTLIRYLGNGQKRSKKVIKHESLSNHYIDLEQLLERIHDESKAKSYLATFARDYQDYPARLTRQTLNNEEFKKLIHNLKGISGTLALTQIYALSYAIDTTYDIERKKILLPQLCNACTETIQEINRMIKNVSYSYITRTRVSYEEAISLLKQISIDLEHGKFIDDGEIETFLDKISPYFNKLDLDGLASTLKRLDYSKSIVMIQKILERWDV